MYTLLSVHSGKVKTITNELLYINEVSKNQLFTFNTKKEAIAYIKKYLCWALSPIKVINRETKINSKVVYYQFNLNNF